MVQGFLNCWQQLKENHLMPEAAADEAAAAFTIINFLLSLLLSTLKLGDLAFVASLDDL